MIQIKTKIPDKSGGVTDLIYKMICTRFCTPGQMVVFILFFWKMSKYAMLPSCPFFFQVIYFNQIRFIHAHAFDDLRRLGDIAWYPPMALVRSSKILQSLQSNNLHCDCNIVSIKNFLKRQKISSFILCTQPPYLNRFHLFFIYF